VAHAGDLVFSSIDLWKGCISVVPKDFDRGLVSKEFPIYEIIDPRLDPEFLSCLLRSRYYQRAFRAITTGHSNRRRTQVADFENLEIAFPPEIEDQRRLIERILKARSQQTGALDNLKHELTAFSAVLDGRGDEELPEVENGESLADEASSEE
jgi:type I restriction enzyme M protein